MEKYIRKLKKLGAHIAGFSKLGLAWCVLHSMKRELLQRDIWLISEKREEARDNGYWFFRYLRETHPQTEAYYVIERNSPDLGKVLKYQNVIWNSSFQHCLYYLAARYSVSSQAFGAYPFHFNLRPLMLANKLCVKGQKTVFLQHGILEKEVSHSLDYDRCNIDFFVCSAPRECEFVKKLYGYPDGATGCIGLCRYDQLNNQRKTERLLLVMPTQRNWLHRIKPGSPLSKEEIERFKGDEYFKKYAELLTDETILNSLREKGYKLYFYLHFGLQDYTPLFLPYKNDVVEICDRFHYDVQDLLKRCAALITDYSSVHFDVAYMNKPVIYYQFDYERFFSKHYGKAYFRYDNDGFGPCCYDHQALVRTVQELLLNNCAQQRKYQMRIDSFFSIRDANNCKRTYEMIRSLS